MKSLQTLSVLLLCSLAMPSWAECIGIINDESGWQVQYADSNAESCFRNGKKHGQWEERSADGRVTTYNVIHGELQ